MHTPEEVEPLSPVSGTDSPGRTSPLKPEIPDGGLKAWSTVAGSWFMMFATFGYLNSFGVYQDFYTREFLSHNQPSKIAWIGSLQLAMPFALGLVSGKLFDLGHFRVLVIAGSIIFSFSLFMLSLVKQQEYYQVFLSQGVGMGIGLGLTFVPSLSILVMHFERRRALASGLALSGSSIGAVIFPIMLNHLIPKLGFAQAVRATAWVVVGCLVAANGLMQNNPAVYNLRAQAPPLDVLSFLTDVPYMIGVFGVLVSLFGCYFPVFYLQLYAVQHGVGQSIAFYSLAILNAASAFGRIGGNFLADRFGPWNLQPPCGLLTGAMIWAVLGVHTKSTLIAVSILYGLFSGAGLSLSVAGYAALARSPRESGARTGLALAIGSFGCLGSAPIQGALLTNRFNWIRPTAFSGIIVCCGGIIFLVTRMLLARQRGTQKV
ncbi:Riboflavin transporter MCH5 [Termitomyces sp. T112]|nr:Riboflavin transporter MCH5 [Termitomyces sp. T112]